MSPKDFFKELKRRNVYRVAITYGVTAWLLAQIVSLAATTFGAPAWVMKMFIVLIITGFPIALILAWAFEMTPQGIARTAPAREETSIPDKRKKSLWSSFIIGILIVVAIGQLLYFKYWDRAETAVSEASVGDVSIAQTDQSIAVLPFDNYSSNEGHQFFAEAVADEIRSQLLALKHLKVISGYSSKHYKGLNLSSRQIGEELDVRYILQGNVQRSDNSVRVSVELSNTRTDKLEWAPPPFERNLDNIFELENEIANQIVSLLSVRLTPRDQEELARVPTENPQAYEAFLQAQEILHTARAAPSKLDQAIVLYEEAIALDSRFDRAYLGLAATYMEFAIWGRMPAGEAVDKALDAVFKVSNTESGEYYGILGAINFYRYKKETAEEYLEKALEMSSNYLGAYVRLAYIRLHEEKFEEAKDLLEQGYSRDPKSLAFPIYKLWYYSFSKQYDEGIAFYEKLLAEHPDDNAFRWSTGYLYAVKGAYDKAIDIFRSRSIARNTNWMLGYALARTGQTEEARKVLDFLLERRKEAHVPAHMIATIYVGLGEHEKALDWLEKDLEEGGHGVFVWGRKLDAKFDPLRKHERFQRLQRVIQ